MPHARTLAILLSAAALAAHGCSGVECGEGTVEKGGDCVLTGEPVGDCNCASGTHFDAELGACLADHPPAVCNPETTVEAIDADGVVHCSGDCGTGCPSACPPPAAGHVTVCGELVDVEIGERITSDGGGTGADCSEIPAGERTGPCLLDVAISDGTVWPVSESLAEVEIDDCGFYVAFNVPEPAFGLFMVSVDDAEGSAAEEWVATATSFAVSTGERITSKRTYVVRRSTDLAWTTAAGNPYGGLTLSEKGVFGFLFLRGDTPVSDVTITRNPEGVVEDSDFYFSDADRHTWSTIEPTQDATGMNGIGLIVDTPLTEHRGEGGPPDCTWPMVTRESVPGLVRVEELVAESPGGGPC
jgi:hypothetical protein